MNYVVFVILLVIFSADVHANTYTNDQTIGFDFETSQEEETVRLSRSRRDDDYSDEGGFVAAPGHSGDDDFIANIRDCADGSTRAPWGKCISCREYQKKFRRIGMGC
ncbi:unnamed protein product [Pieris macdunnoughi]|uniref:Secreted protein n=1 Tax=Pieris macdunnoughi TaxID=345717 RepID=A0A821QRL3_9NEOP|nr:unnamed protein product [Pieris macdunnoughi]